MYLGLVILVWIYLTISTNGTDERLLHPDAEEFDIGLHNIKETKELLKTMRELQRRFAIWPGEYAYNSNRITSLQHGLEKLNSAIEKLNKKLDEESHRFAEIQIGLQTLETKINIMAETKCGKFTTIKTPIESFKKAATRQ